MRPGSIQPEPTGYALRVDTLRSGSVTFLSNVHLQTLEPLVEQLEFCQLLWNQIPQELVDAYTAPDAVQRHVENSFVVEQLWHQKVKEQDNRENQTSLTDTMSEHMLSAIQLGERLSEQAEGKIGLEQLKVMHAAILRAAPEVGAKPGRFRSDLYRLSETGWDVPGDAGYKPPSYHSDLKKLSNTLVRWHDRLVESDTPVWLRAPLFASNLLLIQPFQEANLRVARLLEHSLIKPYYPEEILPFVAEYYANHALPYAGKLIRMAVADDLKDKVKASTDLVAFFLKAMIGAYTAAHSNLMNQMKQTLKTSKIQTMHHTGDLNARQFAIFSQVQTAGKIKLTELRKAPWFLALYENLTGKTKQRDLRKMYDMEVLFLVDKYLYCENPKSLISDNENLNESVAESEAMMA